LSWLICARENQKVPMFFYFKIDKKYRAIGYIEANTFIVTEISDHQ
jgi:hypothetical protein